MKPSQSPHKQQEQLKQTVYLLPAAHACCLRQVPYVSTAAVQHLVNAANKAAPLPPDRVGLSDAVVHAFLDLVAFPPCVLPLLKLATASCRTAEQKAKLKRVLLLLFGDLQAVWADAALSKVLLDLPMPAMQLLLASDELQESACIPRPTGLCTQCCL